MKGKKGFVIVAQIPREKLKNAVVNHIKEQDNSDELFKRIPTFCKIRFRLQCPKFIDSALDAILRYKENSNYVINGRQVRPVDRDNTGMVTWSLPKYELYNEIRIFILVNCN